MPFTMKKGATISIIIIIVLILPVFIIYLLNVEFIGRLNTIQTFSLNTGTHVNMQKPLPRRRHNSSKSSKIFLITVANTPKWLKTATETMNFNRCKFSNCKISGLKNMMPKSDVLLFYGPDLPARSPKRPTNQIWIYLSIESPYNSNMNHKQLEWNYAFNWTITYRNDSDIVFRYGVIVSSEERKYLNYTDIMKNKTKPISWVVSHCNAPSGRDKYVRQLKQYINVDIYGRCGNLKCKTSSFLKCFQNLGLKYKFFLAFENSLCKDYYSEKIYNGYSSKVNMVPIVRGAPGYDKYFPKGTYINTGDFSHPKEVANHLLHMSDTDYLKMLKKKHRYDSTVAPHADIYHNVLCKLCEKLNSDDIKNSKNINIMHWLWNNTCL